jgi:hypothetical protein
MPDFMVRREGKPFESHLAECRRGPNDCWLWPVPGSNGYGAAFYAGKTIGAHRAVYDYLVGPIPDGLTLDHLCRVRNCVNPAHLDPCTIRENILRSEGRAAQNARKDTCPRGHVFDTVNVKDGREERACSICACEHTKAWHRRNPEWVRDVIARNSARRRVVCSRGHLRTPDNTLITMRDGVEIRYCLDCRAESPMLRDASGRLRRKEVA